MLDLESVNQNPLVVELKGKSLVPRPDNIATEVDTFVIVNHSRNNNVKLQISPKSKRPSVPVYTEQNPNTFTDEYRGELKTCLAHANKFIISCAGAPKEFSFATSFGQMLVDLYRSNQNIQIILNGDIHTSSEFIKQSGILRSFDPIFMTPYGLSYVDILGNYKLQVTGVNTVRFELRIYSAGNAMTVQQVESLFGQSLTGNNGTVVYHSNSDFYGFTMCMESSSMPSTTKIDYATVETMEELIDQGIIDSYNNDANNLAIATVDPGAETALAAGFNARLLNEFEPTPVRLQDYLLVLEATGVDLSTVDLSKVQISYSVYKKGS